MKCRSAGVAGTILPQAAVCRPVVERPSLFRIERLEADREGNARREHGSHCRPAIDPNSRRQRVIGATLTFKAEAPDKDRPDYWGPMNFGDGTPVVRASVWLKQKDGRPYVAGSTSFPIPGRTEREQQGAVPVLKDLLDSGAVSQGMPAERKSRRGGSSRG